MGTFDLLGCAVGDIEDRHIGVQNIMCTWGREREADDLP